MLLLPSRIILLNICTDEKPASFYRSIVTAFRQMGYRVVSEGVETKEEMELLRGWEVDMIQGYYFSKPLPGYELLRFFLSEK